MPRGADKPATVVSHSSDSLIKPEIPNLDFALLPGNRELVFSLHVLSAALVSCLQIGIVEDLSAGTIDVLNVAGDYPHLLGKTGHRHGQGSRNSKQLLLRTHFIGSYSGAADSGRQIEALDRRDGL